MNAISYKDPSFPSPLLAALGNDQYVAMAVQATGSVVLVKGSIADLGNAPLISVAPYVTKATGKSVYTLSANELNTMLGATGSTATKDSYFTLSFSPEATMNGATNMFTMDLQAVAVMQGELQYGVTATEDGSGKVYPINTKGYIENAYSSLYPLPISFNKSTFAQLTNPDNLGGYDNTTAQWVAIRNTDGKYLVVDRAYISGTEQTSNKRITFAWDDLYNAKNETRFRDPRSYLFRFDYNPSTGAVEVHSMAYIKYEAIDDATGSLAPHQTAFDEAAFYGSVTPTNGYSTQPIQKGSVWYTCYGGNTNNFAVASNVTAGTYSRANDESFVIMAKLSSVKEVTLGKPADDNQFAITLGTSALYQPTYVASGAYLLKVVGSKTTSRIGKYLVKNLAGGPTEYMEQAVRQNFQHMPSAQWVVKSVGTTAGSPITVVNREFTSPLYTNVTPFGVVGGANQAFVAGGDTLEYIPVADAMDKKLGYKYVAADTIELSTFTFNYLHQLGMDKPINTLSQKDSVVWVDANGESMKFVLERAIENDAYGTNLGLSNVAALQRDAYYIKVKDASKLHNDGRYLKYDDQQKKYVVSTTGKDKFFLKENNEVEGGSCYYTLLVPSTQPVISAFGTIAVGKKLVGADGTNIKGSGAATIVRDNDLRNRFDSGDGSVMNTETGVWGDAKVIPSYLISGRVESFESFVKYSNFDVIVYDPSNMRIEAISRADANSAVKNLFYNDHKDNSTYRYILRYNDTKIYSTLYASDKVSVDNNTLNLTHGNLSDDSYNEVANSAFAVVRDASQKYRRLNTEADGADAEDPDAPKNVKFFRVNSAEKAYLYEDASSIYSKDLAFNFLGVEDKGIDGKKASIYVDTAYVDRGDNVLMPQYMLALRPEFVEADTVLCDASTHSHATTEEALACDHSYTTKGYLDAWYLVNLSDSVAVHEGKDAAKFKWNNDYVRLGFVQARHIGDTLVIKNSIYTGDNTRLKPYSKTDFSTVASKDSIYLGDNKHKNVAFSFRLIDDSDNFLIESKSNAWVKIQNGVPVIAQKASYNEGAKDAEVFNLEATEEAPTANEVVAAEVSVVAAQGAIIVKGAAGKVVTVANILGQTIANQVAASDNVTIAAPAGVAVVTVDGEATKVIVK